jgi:hypothetical protein
MSLHTQYEFRGGLQCDQLALILQYDAAFGPVFMDYCSLHIHLAFASEGDPPASSVQVCDYHSDDDLHASVLYPVHYFLHQCFDVHTQGKDVVRVCRATCGHYRLLTSCTTECKPLAQLTARLVDN